MLRIAKLSAEIRNVVNSRPGVSDELIRDGDVWNRLTSAMDLLDDTALGLLEFETKAFGGKGSGEAYLRFYGTMQAMTLQQDAISTIHEAIFAAKLDSKLMEAWSDLRRFRNLASGHPLDKRGKDEAGKLRTFVARASIAPDSILVISVEEKTGAARSERFPLRQRYDSYKNEAINVLCCIRQRQESRWASGDAA